MIGLSWPYGESREPDCRRIRPAAGQRLRWLLPVTFNEPTVINAWTAPQVKCQISGIAPGKGILKLAAWR
jgi:hypothetical protein